MIRSRTRRRTTARRGLARLWVVRAPAGSACVALAVLWAVVAGCGGGSEEGAARDQQSGAIPQQETAPAGRPSLSPAAASEPGDQAAAPQPAPQPAPPHPPAQPPLARPAAARGIDAPAPPALSLPRLPDAARRPPAPELTLTDLGGRQIRLGELRGRAVLITFWATWCGPCRQEIPQLVRWQETYGGRGLTILGISLDQQGLPVVRTFVRERPEISYTIIPNGARAAEAFGGVERIPTAFLLDKRGRVVARFQGLPRGTEVEGYIQAVLRES